MKNKYFSNEYVIDNYLKKMKGFIFEKTFEYLFEYKLELDEDEDSEEIDFKQTYGNSNREIRIVFKSIFKEKYSKLVDLYLDAHKPMINKNLNLLKYVFDLGYGVVPYVNREVEEKLFRKNEILEQEEFNALTSKYNECNNICFDFITKQTVSDQKIINLLFNNKEFFSKLSIEYMSDNFKFDFYKEVFKDSNDIIFNENGLYNEKNNWLNSNPQNIRKIFTSKIDLQENIELKKIIKEMHKLIDELQQEEKNLFGSNYNFFEKIISNLTLKDSLLNVKILSEDKGVKFHINKYKEGLGIEPEQELKNIYLQTIIRKGLSENYYPTQLITELIWDKRFVMFDVDKDHCYRHKAEKDIALLDKHLHIFFSKKILESEIGKNNYEDVNLILDLVGSFHSLNKTLNSHFGQQLASCPNTRRLIFDFVKENAKEMKVSIQEYINNKMEGVWDEELNPQIKNNLKGALSVIDSELFHNEDFELGFNQYDDEKDKIIGISKDYLSNFYATKQHFSVNYFDIEKMKDLGFTISVQKNEVLFKFVNFPEKITEQIKMKSALITILNILNNVPDPSSHIKELVLREKLKESELLNKPNENMKKRMKI